MDLSSQLLSKENLIIMVATWSLIRAVTKFMPGLGARPLFHRLKPTLSIAICGGILMLPNVHPGLTWDNGLILAFVLGAGTSHVHKIFKQGFERHEESY